VFTVLVQMKASRARVKTDTQETVTTALVCLGASRSFMSFSAVYFVAVR